MTILVQSEMPVSSEATSQIARLQLLQCLVDQSQAQTMTLADMIRVLSQMQQQYGAEMTIESLIQYQVGLHLQAQYEERKRRRVEVAS